MANNAAIKALKFVGGFKLLQKIGQGGMGTVFKACQVSLDREVALKILPPKIAQKDAVFVERFFREARTSAKLNHPSIVQGIEVGKDEETGLYYFAMEYIDGPTVKQLIAEKRTLDEKTSLKIIKGVCEALICAHKAGIIHRDIKPDNILLNAAGEPKLADLGLARVMLDSSLDEGPADGTGVTGGADLTQAGMAVGTPSYMAPEQVRGQLEELDARTDLYELGATWFHMVTGRPPYQAEGAHRVMELHLVAPVPNAHAINPTVSEATSKIINLLMQKDRNNRIQSAELLLVQIEKLMNPTATDRHQAVDAQGVGQYPITGDRTRISTRESRLSGRQMDVPVSSGRSGPNWKWIAGGFAAGLPVLIGMFFLLGGDGDSKLDVAQGSLENGSGLNGSVSKGSPGGVGSVKENNINSKGSAPQVGPAGTKATLEELAAGWPALKKTLEQMQQTPKDYQMLLGMLHTAEKGASEAVVAKIRSECVRLEKVQKADFEALYQERFALASAQAGQRDFAAAMKIFEVEKFPPQMLSEESLAEIRRVYASFESRAINDYNSNFEPELSAELESAARDISLLQTLQKKIEQSRAKYGIKSVQDRLETLRQRVDAAIIAAKLPPKAAPPIETAQTPIDANVDLKVALPSDPKIVTTKPIPVVEVPKKVEKVADVKPGIPEPKNKNRKKDPKECLEWRSKFLQRAEARIHQFETKKNFAQIIELAYKMEDYQRTAAVLERVLREGSVNGRDNEVWLAGIAWEVGLLIPNSNPQKLDALVQSWKNKALAAIENVKLDEQENRWTRWDTPHDVAKVEEREAFFKSWQKPLQDDLKKMELAGEDDPKYLWDLAMRYQDQKKPWIPLRYMNMLLKLRAWHDDFAHVKSGEVQVRLTRLLSEQFAIQPEAIVEATSVIDKYPKHEAVVSGEICWILAENNLALAKDQQMNKDKVPYYEEAKKYYDQYRKIAHAHNNKIHPGAHQSETQRKLEDVNSNLSRMKPKN